MSRCYLLVVLNGRSSHQRCFLRKGALKNFANDMGNQLCQSLFFNKVAGPKLHASGTGVFLWILQNLKNTLFYRTPLGDCFWNGQWYVLGLPSAKNHSYPFSHQNIHFSQVTMWFLTPTHIHTFFALFNQKKKTKNRYTRKQFLFYETLKSEF